MCRCNSTLALRHRRSTSAETDRKQMSTGNSSQKPFVTVRRVDVDPDHDAMRLAPTGNANGAGVTPDSGGPAPEITDDVTDADEDDDEELPDGGVVAINNCVAAVGVAMASVATPNYARRQSAIVRLTRLRQQIGVGLHSADNVRVPIWLSLLLVVVYIAVGAVIFSAGESVSVTSELFLRCSLSYSHPQTFFRFNYLRRRLASEGIVSLGVTLSRCVCVRRAANIIMYRLHAALDSAAKVIYVLYPMLSGSSY